MSTQTDNTVEPGPGEVDRPAAGAPGLGAYTSRYVRRVRGGELGSIPAIVGLVVITAFFAIVHQGFLTAYNVEALVIQAAPVIIMAIGLIFVLLLGEIDLSAGTTGGLCSALFAVLSVRQGWSWWLSVIVGIALGLVIGLSMGWLRARLGIPSFVITLATFLGFQGITLILIGGQGSITLQSGPIIDLENSFVPVWLGWVLFAAFVLVYAAIKFNDALTRRRAGLTGVPFSVLLVKILVVAILGGVFTYMMGLNRNVATNAFFATKSEGMPWSVLLLVLLFAIMHFMLSRTRYGRHVYAVGGNDEAARRAGIAISRIRISVFVICSGMAAISGLVAASYLQSVNSGAGAQNTLLLAVGAAVIGGTSLFGGRGRIIDAVIGGLVVAVINNGMSDLIQGANSTGYNWIVTGGVLLLAAGFDAVVRSRSKAS